MDPAQGVRLADEVCSAQRALQLAVEIEVSPGLVRDDLHVAGDDALEVDEQPCGHRTRDERPCEGQHPSSAQPPGAASPTVPGAGRPQQRHQHDAHHHRLDVLLHDHVPGGLRHELREDEHHGALQVGGEGDRLRRRLRRSPRPEPLHAVLPHVDVPPCLLPAGEGPSGRQADEGEAGEREHEERGAAPDDEVEDRERRVLLQHGAPEPGLPPEAAPLARRRHVCAGQAAERPGTVQVQVQGEEAAPPPLRPDALVAAHPLRRRALGREGAVANHGPATAAGEAEPHALLQATKVRDACDGAGATRLSQGPPAET
mmetsp:Transcript_112296/g.358455  ORF Transcript_112296/g.358455 Transcript_112296/m.358455 type:complete len:315 (-) Transcript_112296:475-1419(-)